ncbi:uncharacterized protein LOC143883026 [Tasmannia lanceolata]|uniref:uncharacterized protein LOC143883026 n=1 Tax=Tasmannia lanceolata TaxID=3420 RepID=UPI004062C834
MDVHKLSEDVDCVYCKAKRFRGEPPTFCCQKGQVFLHTNEIPEELYRLYTEQEADCKKFQELVRGYNSAFAFTSMGVHVDKNMTSLKKGVYTFKIHRQLHHYIPSLMPTDSCSKFLQLYFYDTDHESDNRLHHIPDLRQDVVDKLISILEINPYSQFLRSLKHHDSLEDCIIIINKDCKLDQRVYNAPIASQVATIWIEGVNNDSLHTRDIILQSHSGHLYQGIVDSVAAGETQGCKIGKRIVLPTSFIGGPRDKRCRYLDSMALVQHYGKPDIFLTMTCNPEWEEIVLHFKAGEKAYNRPDLTTRVFKGKFDDLKKQLFEKHALGHIIAHAHVIEFQKRGLPHAHLLLTMQKESKMLNPDEYNNIVCAELPDKNTEPLLFAIAVKHMMHGPCGI